MRMLTPQEEAEHISKKYGLYIPPYKLTQITNNAVKVMQMLTKNNVCMTYQECLLTLQLAEELITKRGGEVLING